MLYPNNSRWLPVYVLAISAAIHILLLQYFYEDWSFSFADGLVSAIIFTLCVWTGSLLVNKYPTRIGLFIYALFIGIISGIIAWYIDGWILQWWFHDEVNYLALFNDKKIQFIRAFITIIFAAWLLSIFAFKKENNELADKMKHLSDAATLHREAELFKLRQQLQPHFLYNSLNSISALIMIMPDKALEMIGKLSDFLRSSIKREAEELIPIQDELEYIEAYLSIETVRFGDRLKVIYNKKFLDACTIPPFLLQPILENAIKFGLYGNTGEVVIKINILLKDSFLILSVINPITEGVKTVSGTGFGLEGIHRRLYLLYARTDLLETKQEANTFTTMLKIPQDV